MIRPGENILLDAGSTMAALAHELRGCDKLSVTTPASTPCRNWSIPRASRWRNSRPAAAGLKANVAKWSQWSVFLRQSWEEIAEALRQKRQDCFHVPALPALSRRTSRADATAYSPSNFTRTPPLVAANSRFVAMTRSRSITSACIYPNHGGNK